METQEIDKNEFVRRCKRLWEPSFKEFVHDIILYPQGFENQPFHDELDDDIAQKFDPSTAVFKMVQRFFAVFTYPRDHGKSSHLSAFYPLWRIAKDHNIRILSISLTSAIAEKFLSEVKTNIETNEMYRSFARSIDPGGIGVIKQMKPGSNQPQDWSTTSITVERSEKLIKDPTIAATGLFGQILSRRADLIICDDIVDQANSMTDLQRKKVIDWLETTVMPVLVPGGTFIYLGNTWHVEDVVSKFLNDPRFIVAKRQGAIIKEAKRQDLWTEWGRILTNMAIKPKERFEMADKFYNDNRVEMDEGAEVLWKQRYPYSRLYLERLLSPYVFARMYQCDPSNRPDQKFRDEWIERALERGKHLRMSDIPHEKNIIQASAAGLDVAAGLEMNHDDTACAYLDFVKYGYDGVKDGDYLLRNIHRGHYTFEEQVTAAKNAIANGMQSVRVESNGYQKVLTQRLKNDHVQITDYTTTGREKFDPISGIGGLAGLFERDQIVIPSDPTDMHTMTMAAKLATELRAWTGDSTEHTGDGLMALWFAFSETNDILGNGIVFPSAAAMGVKDSPAVQAPEVREELEKEADDKIRIEQEYERSEFNRLMRQSFIDRRRQ